MAVQEVPRESGTALEHEHCSCYQALREVAEAAQVVIDSINDENEIDPDAIFRLSAALDGQAQPRDEVTPSS